MDNEAWLRCLTKFERTDSGCWVWTGTIIKSGYGQFWLDGKMRYAHRVVYEHLVGPIPEGLHLDHQCHNRDRDCVAGWACPHRRCVNPDPVHLEPVTQRVNNLRSQSPAAKHAAKTHCHRGHPLSGGNLYRTPRGSRDCRTCATAAKRRYRERNHGVALARP